MKNIVYIIIMILLLGLGGCTTATTSRFITGVFYCADGTKESIVDYDVFKEKVAVRRHYRTDGAKELIVDYDVLREKIAVRRHYRMDKTLE